MDSSDTDESQTDLNRLGEWAVEKEMKINPDESKAVSFTKARVKERIRYYFGEHLILEASGFKYLEIITRNDLNWTDHVKYALRKARKVLHFITSILKKGNNNTKRLAYMTLGRPILDYGAVCWDPYREGQVSALNQVQKRVAEFANINKSDWETMSQRRLIVRICALFKVCTGRQAWKAIGNRLLKPCYLRRGDHNRKIRTRKQRTDVGKFSFVNRIVKSWNQLPASLLTFFFYI